MVNAETRDKAVKAAEIDLKAEMAEIEKEKNAARERTAEDEKQLAEWNAKRNKAREGVDETCCGISIACRSFADRGWRKFARKSAWDARSCCVRRPTTKCVAATW